jgi:NAD(P)-dependent dehydrogenase (short-subunit alcohol dehydrogenase family)
MKELDNKVVVVTGGNCGIGRATALAFAQKGAKVVITIRRIKESEETIQLLKIAGSAAIFVKTDGAKAVEIRPLAKIREGRSICVVRL